MIIVVFGLLSYNLYVKKLLYRQAILNSINAYVDATGLSLIPNFHYGSLENVSRTKNVTFLQVK